MKLAEIKSKLDITTLELRPSATQDGEDTGWLRHWDDTRRLSISIPRDLAKELVKMPDKDDLTLSYESRVSSTSNQQYDSYRIIVPEVAVEITL